MIAAPVSIREGKLYPFISTEIEEQEILKNLQAAHSLSPPSPLPLPFSQGKRFNFSSSWFPVTCYGQFAVPVCKELNVCTQLENL